MNPDQKLWISKAKDEAMETLGDLSVVRLRPEEKQKFMSGQEKVIKQREQGQRRQM